MRRAGRQQEADFKTNPKGLASNDTGTTAHKSLNTLTHQNVDVFFCYVISEELHQILPQVSVQLRLDVELVLKKQI